MEAGERVLKKETQCEGRESLEIIKQERPELGKTLAFLGFFS